MAVLLAIGLIALVMWQRSREANEREEFARTLAEEHARAERAQQQAATQQSSNATHSTQPSVSPQPSGPPMRSGASAETSQPTTSRVKPPPTTIAIPTTTVSSRGPATTPSTAASVPSVPASPFDGTWKIDSGMTRYQSTEEHLLQNGKFGTSAHPFPADGSFHKATGSANFDELSVRILDDHNVEVLQRKEGKETFASRYSVSADGDTLTENFVNNRNSVGGAVAGKRILRRVKPGPDGSHLISGSWRLEKVEGLSENALLFTIKSVPGGLSYRGPNGATYTAQFDGSEAPLTGSTRYSSVSLRRSNDRFFRRD